MIYYTTYSMHNKILNESYFGIFYFNKEAPVAQQDRASDYESEG